MGVQLCNNAFIILIKLICFAKCLLRERLGLITHMTSVESCQFGLGDCKCNIETLHFKLGMFERHGHILVKEGAMKDAIDVHYGNVGASVS